MEVVRARQSPSWAAICAAASRVTAVRRDIAGAVMDRMATAAGVTAAGVAALPTPGLAEPVATVLGAAADSALTSVAAALLPLYLQDEPVALYLAPGFAHCVVVALAGGTMALRAAALEPLPFRELATAAAPWVGVGVGTLLPPNAASPVPAVLHALRDSSPRAAAVSGALRPVHDALAWLGLPDSFLAGIIRASGMVLHLCMFHALKAQRGTVSKSGMSKTALAQCSREVDGLAYAGIAADYHAALAASYGRWEGCGNKTWFKSLPQWPLAVAGRLC